MATKLNSQFAVAIHSPAEQVTVNRPEHFISSISRKNLKSGECDSKTGNAKRRCLQNITEACDRSSASVGADCRKKGKEACQKIRDDKAAPILKIQHDAQDLALKELKRCIADTSRCAGEKASCLAKPY
jgi:hypothetical protein